MSEVYRCWHKLAAEELAEYGLNSPHAVYLNVLYKFEEGITAAQLSVLCSKNKADVSRMVSIMEEKGIVKKEAVGDNLYRAKIKLTERGKEAAEHVRERAALAVELAGGGLSGENREIFYNALELITSNLQTLSKEGLPRK